MEFPVTMCIYCGYFNKNPFGMILYCPSYSQVVWGSKTIMWLQEREFWTFAIFTLKKKYF